MQARPSCSALQLLPCPTPFSPSWFPHTQHIHNQLTVTQPQPVSTLVSPHHSHFHSFCLPATLTCAFFLLAACDCNPRGIQTPQCDRATGQCICNEGVEGPRCDKCSRGYSGFFPDCVPCHQCFALWDVVIGELANRTQQFLDRANALKITGVTGPYQQTLSTLEEKLGEIKTIIAQNPAAEPLKNIGNLFEEAE